MSRRRHVYRSRIREFIRIDGAELTEHPERIELGPPLGDLPVRDPEDHDPFEGRLPTRRFDPQQWSLVGPATDRPECHSICVGDDVLDRPIDVRKRVPECSDVFLNPSGPGGESGTIGLWFS